MNTRDTHLLPDVAAAIGHTPLVALDRLTRHAGVKGRILAKLEYLNPGFSKKDRIALAMIDESRASGALQAGQTVVERTSGNTGTGLAIVCAVRGHPFIAVMSRGNSVERARMMSALGAEVVLVEQAPGSQPNQVSGADLDLVDEMAQRLTTERNAFRADQFSLRGNFNAHYQHTGPEIWAQSNGQVTAFCDYVGSGGTFGGCAAYFKSQDPKIACYIVEPAGAAVLAGKNVAQPNHRIQGGGYAMSELTMLHKELADGFLQVTDDQATKTARDLARFEGIFAGFSSGANVCGALTLLQGPAVGATVAVTICDSGLKYLSTDLWLNV